jgi:hypothetical protein
VSELQKKRNKYNREWSNEKENKKKHNEGMEAVK